MAILVRAVLALSLLPWVSHSQDRVQTRVISPGLWVGCTKEAEYRELAPYMDARDDAALAKAAEKALRKGRCVWYQPGESLYLEDMALFSPMVKLRRNGQVQAYWTHADALVPLPAPAPPAASAGSPPSLITVQGGDHLGCRAREAYSEIAGYATAGDPAAFQAAASQSIDAGQCTVFAVGESVHLEGLAVLKGLAQLRRPGDTVTYWTAIEATLTAE